MATTTTRETRSYRRGVRVGQCVLCGGTLESHFDAQSRYLGCKGRLVFLPPMMVMLTPDMLATLQHAMPVTPHVPAQTTEHVAHERPARRRMKTSATDATPKLATGEPKRGRGRIAGVYLARATEPTKLTDSMKRVYEFVRAHKRGTAAKDIMHRLGMPMGTVGWALGQLLKQNSVEHVMQVA